MNSFLSSDKELLTDSLNSQKHIESNYNTFANECVNVALKNDLLNILKEEHDIQHELFTEMKNRGWYATEPADPNKITQAKQALEQSFSS